MQNPHFDLWLRLFLTILIYTRKKQINEKKWDREYFFSLQISNDRVSIADFMIYIYYFIQFQFICPFASKTFIIIIDRIILLSNFIKFTFEKLNFGCFVDFFSTCILFVRYTFNGILDYRNFICWLFTCLLKMRMRWKTEQTEKKWTMCSEQALRIKRNKICTNWFTIFRLSSHISLHGIILKKCIWYAF